MFKFIKHIREAIRFKELTKDKRRIVFYSEGKNYWVHLEGLLKEFIKISEIPVCYISSGENDPGLLLKHPNYRSFKIDEGFVRNWLFENIETDVMVMTMPDIDQYQVKKSKHNVHYVYVQHSLVSFHMVYRKGALDHYDTIFCAGPHHINEIRALEAHYNLPEKKLVKHGYARLDEIIDKASKIQKEKIQNKPKHILLAPSWGPDSIIESGVGAPIVDQLLEEGFKITLRPHPQTNIFAKEKVDEIVNKHKENALFKFEDNVAGQQSLHDSDLMICDWSGAALDYAFGLNKQVAFIDVPRKVNNPEYQEIDIEPFEVSIRNKIGKVFRPLEKLDLDFSIEINNKLKEQHIYNIGNSSVVGAKELLKIIENYD